MQAQNYIYKHPAYICLAMKYVVSLFLCSIFYKSYAQPFYIIGKEVNPYHYTITKSFTFQKACVASAHPLASMVGVAVMHHGGNAFDAIIATQLALAVVYPGAGNIGGGGFLLARDMHGKLTAIDYREKAPAAASRNMYLDSAGNVINGLSENGHLSCGVPGTVAGLFATLQYARLPFKELIQPAIDFGRKRFTITENEADALNANKKFFLQYNTQPVPFVKTIRMESRRHFIAA